MKKILIVLSIILLAGMTYWAFPMLDSSLLKNKFTQKKPKEKGKIYFDFTKLPDGLVAQSGEHKVTTKEIENSAAMKAFRNKKRNVLFVLIYKQYVNAAEEKPKSLELSFKKISRAPSAILNQYGIPVVGQTKVTFSAFDKSDGIAKVDGSIITEESLDRDNYIWASFESEIFRYKLSALDKKLKHKIISAEAKKLNIPVAAYREKYIVSKLNQEISQNDILSYMKNYNLDDTERNQKSAKNRLLEMRKQRGEDYILEKFVMELPVKIALKEPGFNLETKNEWTPFLGKEGSPLEITLFSSTRQSKNQELLKGLLPLLKKYKGIRFNYRPFFLKNDRLQDTVTQMHFCAWMSDKENFWDYFLETTGDFKDETESKLYEIADNKGMDVDALKACLLKQQFKKVVSYHLDYAAYLGIQASPVLYLGGEVLSGAIYLHDIEKIIQRKLQIPTAGVW